MKSRANQVNWRLDESDVSDLSEATSFVVTLPESSVGLNYYSPRVEDDQYVVSFNNKNEVTVKRLVINEDHPSWELARSLFDEAGRVTVGWDKVFDDLENAVKSDKPIGFKPTNPYLAR